MMACNQPLRPVPAIGVRVARLNDRSRSGEGECVKPSVYSGVAPQFNVAAIDFPRRAILKKVTEVVLLFSDREPWLVRYGRKKNGTLRILGDHLVRIAGVQRLISSIEPRRSLL